MREGIESVYAESAVPCSHLNDPLASRFVQILFTPCMRDNALNDLHCFICNPRIFTRNKWLRNIIILYCEPTFLQDKLTGRWLSFSLLCQRGATVRVNIATSPCTSLAPLSSLEHWPFCRPQTVTASHLAVATSLTLHTAPAKTMPFRIA